jgi:hypothetical protein
MPRSSRGARLHPPPRGGRRGADQTLPRLHGGASLHPPPQSQRGSNPQQTQRNKRTKKRKTKKRSKFPFLSPTQGRISPNPSTNTLSTYGFKNDSFATPQSFESPQFDCINVGRETFLNDDTDKEYKCSHCLEPYLACNFDPTNPSLPFLVCEHRFCQECIEIMEGLQNCPIADC